MIGVLKDDRLNGFMFSLALSERIDFIQREIDVAALKLTPEQQARLNKLIAEHAQRSTE